MKIAVEMSNLNALVEVERLAREVVDHLDSQMNVLHGECETECKGVQECGATVTGSEKCPKCGEMVDFEKECAGEVECDEVCSTDVALDLPDEEQDLLKQLRLALVQLDLARASEGK